MSTATAIRTGIKSADALIAAARERGLDVEVEETEWPENTTYSVVITQPLVTGINKDSVLALEIRSTRMHLVYVRSSRPRSQGKYSLGEWRNLHRSHKVNSPKAAMVWIESMGADALRSAEQFGNGEQQGAVAPSEALQEVVDEITREEDAAAVSELRAAHEEAEEQQGRPAKIRLQGVGWVPAVEASDLVVGDRVMWNFGSTSEVLAIKDASPAFLVITFRSQDGKVNDRRMKKAGRSVARVAQAPVVEAAPQEAVSASVSDQEQQEVAQERQEVLVTVEGLQSLLVGDVVVPMLAPAGVKGWEVESMTQPTEGGSLRLVIKGSPIKQWVSLGDTLRVLRLVPVAVACEGCGADAGEECTPLSMCQAV